MELKVLTKEGRTFDFNIFIFKILLSGFFFTLSAKIVLHRATDIVPMLTRCLADDVCRLDYSEVGRPNI